MSVLRSALPELKKAVFSQPVLSEIPSKIILRPVFLRGEIYYQLERFSGGKAFHENLREESVLRTVSEELDGKYRQVLIQTDTQSAQYCLRRNGGYKRSTSPAVPRPGGAMTHNRVKEYILSEGEDIPAMVELGVFTKDFRVVASRYDKFKQINRFIQLIDDEFAGCGKKQLTVLDFGCGKSYLTFIMYYYFTVKKGMDVKIIGYDLKTDVVEKCNAIAEKYGYTGLSFVAADVTKDKLYDRHIDMVVTLHACDTATDYALDYAIRKKADYIFSVPCCQHEVNLSIRRGGELDIFMEHGIVKERMCALLTDSVRCAVLESAGYRVDMIEFVDFEHSPKNLMIRARRGGAGKPGQLKAAKALQEKYSFDHALLRLSEDC